MGRGKKGMEMEGSGELVPTSLASAPACCLTRSLLSLQEYIDAHPETIVLDPLPAIRTLLDRSKSYELIRKIEAYMKGTDACAQHPGHAALPAVTGGPRVGGEGSCLLGRSFLSLLLPRVLFGRGSGHCERVLLCCS